MLMPKTMDLPALRSHGKLPKHEVMKSRAIHPTQPRIKASSRDTRGGYLQAS